jgi:hypothetical protein
MASIQPLRSSPTVGPLIFRAGPITESMSIDRRREARTVVNMPVRVTELDPPGQPPQGGILIDVSKNGMLVRISHAIASGTLLRVETPEILTLGEVVRCVPHEEAFDVALALRHSLEGAIDQILSFVNRGGA